MKSQRRHELQENTLIAELGKMVDVLRKRGNLVGWGVLIAALIAMIAVFAWKKSRQGDIELQRKFDRVMPLKSALSAEERLEGLKELAEQDDDEVKAALATVELGDVYARRMVVAGPNADPAQWKRLADQAAGYYREAINRFGEQDLPLAKAHLGLAKLAESQQDFETAKAEYQAVLKLTALTGQPVMQQAERGMQQLETLSSPVQMATTAPATRPATQPAREGAATGQATSGPATMPAETAPAK